MPDLPDLPRARRISPKLVTDNMPATVVFYRDVLGFTAVMNSPEYTILERDGQTIHFGNAASGEIMNRFRNHTEIYIEVSGIHALWEHARVFRDRYHMRDLFDQPYGMTEFHISDPNGCLVFVGQPTAP